MGTVRLQLRAHWPLVAVLGAGLLVRVAVAIAYRPALFFSDSWAYIALAYDSDHFATDRPRGYPLLLRLIELPGRSLLAITTLQHLAGLGTGLLTYLLLLRAGTGRLIATVAAAAVTLNAYAIVLEQTILAETFFTAAVLASFYLVAGEHRSTWMLALAGVLLALAVTMRTGGVFAIPIWLAYVIYRDRLRALVALAALAVSLLVYAAAYDSRNGHFGLASAGGWFLYGRVGEIADCKVVDPPPGTRDLCEPLSAAQGRGPLYYIWSPGSPANRRFPHGIETPGSSDVLKGFAVSVIKQRPLAYAGIVARDTVRFFIPGARSAGRSDNAITLPRRPRTGQPWMTPALRDRLLPGFEPQTHAPSGLARAYAAVMRVPRPLLALLALLPLALVPLALRAPPGTPPAHLPEALALSLAGLAMLAGQAATSGFIVRYLVPSVPLMICAGALATADLLAWRRGRRRRAPDAREPGAR